MQLLVEYLQSQIRKRGGAFAQGAIQAINSDAEVTKADMRLLLLFLYL